MMSKTKRDLFNIGFKLVISGLLVAAIVPVITTTYGWFSHTRDIRTISKIENPTAINISSGNKENYICLDLAGLNLTSEEQYKDFVFGVSGLNVNHYRLQLAYTTNNQLEFAVYRANFTENAAPAPDGNQGVVDYYMHDGSNDHVIYYIPSSGSPLSGTFLNKKNDEILGKDSPDSFYNDTYGTYGNVNQYAVPIYWQTGMIDSENVDGWTREFCDYFILRVSWQGARSNNKETDIIYITARNEAL